MAEARNAPLPDFIPPELATLVKDVPVDAGWVYEIKLDGYRMLARITDGKATMFSRSAKDWTGNFPSIATALGNLPVDTAWLDGEVVVIRPDGRTSFQALQNALTTDHTERLRYFVFDLLYLDGYDLRGAPLTERKRLLADLLAAAQDAIRLSEHVEGSGTEVLRQASALKLEGIIAKRAQSSYVGGRGRSWVKVKCIKRQEMVIGGYTDPQGSRSGFGALLLGVYTSDGTLRYSGKVGTGFNEATLNAMYKRLKALEIDTSAFSNPPRGYEAKGAHWIKPELVAEIAFTEWTNDGTLRHPSFQGLREDKKPTEVVREEAAETPELADARKRSWRSAARRRSR